MKQKLLIASLGASVVFLASCGDDERAGGAGGSFQVGTLAGAATGLMSTGLRPAAVTSADLVKSSTAYSYAHVDGIKLTVAQVRGADANSNNPLTTATIGEEITLTRDSSAAAFSASVNWELGSYEGVDILANNSWKVKAYCKTAESGGNYTLVYTTAAGVATASCTSDECTLPDAYDYYSYSWLDDYYTQAGQAEKWITTRFNFSVAAGDTPKVSMLFDPTNSVVCWDGTNRDTGKLGYFQGPDSARSQTLWPDSTPAFAVISNANFPLLTYVTTSADEAAPVGRTFFTATSQATLEGSLAANLASTYTVSIVFKADGTPVVGATRPFPGTGTTIPLNGELEGFTANGSGWDFYDSSFRWDGTANAAAFVKNRKFVGWTLPTTRYAAFSSTVNDGPDCGQTLLDFQGNDASRDCISGGTQTYYWKEIEL